MGILVEIREVLGINSRASKGNEDKRITGRGSGNEIIMVDEVSE
jgi:hypothetical protein